MGRGLLIFAPRMMRALTIIATVAMFLVGVGILAHGIPAVFHWQLAVAQNVPEGLVTGVFNNGFAGLFGFAAGGLLVAVFMLAQKLKHRV